MSWLHLVIIAPFLFAFFIPFLHKGIRLIHTGWFVILLPLTLFIYFLSFLSHDLAGQPVSEILSWIPSLNIYFHVYMDGLAHLFALIITGIGTLVVLYSIFYMSKEREALHNFYVYLLMFMGAMLGTVLSDNLMVLYAFWEVTSVSSFLLIAYWYQRKNSRQGAQKSMLITMSGGFAMLLGFIMLYSITGTFSIRELIGSLELLTEHFLFIPAMFLILLGAFTKSAQFPFHIWLPDAMEAPTPISAYLHSATMVKAGVYLIARFTPIYGGQMEWFWLIISFGIITLFWGSFMAVKQFDLKALLAYSTISQLGLIVTLLGIGSLAYHDNYQLYVEPLSGATLAAIFHLINHSVFKGCLFMVIGILDHETGTRDIRKLGGLMSIMPISFTLTLIGALSMAGLPPFSGFLSKEMFFTGVLTASTTLGTSMIWLPIVAWIASVFTFIYCFILVFKSFTGKYEPTLLDKKPREASIGMLISPIILGSLVIIFFFFPNLISTTILEPTMHAILPNLLPEGAMFDTNIQAWHGWNTELAMTTGVVVFGTLLYISLPKWTGIYGTIPSHLTINHAYNQTLTTMERISRNITTVYMTGNVQHYLGYIFVSLIALLGSSLVIQQAVILKWQNVAPIELFEWVTGICIVAAAIYLLFSKSRITSIIAISAIGFFVALFFVIFRAPDLALTQLVVETISTALFLLCFYFLPKLKKEISRIPFRVVHFLISLGVGTVLTLIGLSVQGHRLFDSIAYYFEQSYELAGAKNMVNAILVDFRAFDTMLEIVVLFAAGLGVYSLVKLRNVRRHEK